MSKRNRKQQTVAIPAPAPSAAENFLHRALVHVTGVLALLISISFFTATYDTAQVKLTLLHMGSLLLGALWGSLQITRRKNPFTRQNIPFLLPVFAYVGWNVLCYIFAPYHAEAAEEFIRFLLYGLITLLAATEFSFNDVKTVTKWFLIAVWISLAYAVLQIADGFFQEIDPMPWRGSFTKRLFSTHANPNFFADFLIFASCITAGVYLAQRKKSLLALLVVGIVALFFTESKGAWLAYAAAVAFLTWMLVNFCIPALAKHRQKINLLVALALLGSAVLAGCYTAKRFQSVRFRAHTWLGTFEMVKAAPVMGVGIGNFKVIYPAYRRAQIFYIEDSHNTETQHAENELLEQWTVSGTVGLAVFLWLMYTVFALALRTLRQTEQLPQQRFYLLGYTAALGGMFVHSGVDISLHFASSGFFFALITGTVFALCQPGQNRPENTAEITPSRLWLLGILRFILAAGTAVLVVLLLRYFWEITSVLGKKTTGEVITVALSWIVLAGSLLAGSYVILGAARRIRNAVALLPLVCLLPLELVAYFPFQSNHYYSLGITLNQLGNIEGSLGYFTKAIRFNPLQAEYRQFRANLLSITFNLTKQFSPLRGDKTTPSDDFTRALRDYAFVEKQAPNHPLLHHNKGQLYYTMALNRSDTARYAHSPAEYELFKQEALHYMDQAKHAFERSLLVDPVNAQTYFYLVQIALLENNPQQAQAELERFYRGPDGVTETEFLDKHRRHPQAAALQAQIDARLRTRNRP
ncbi:MAG: O-antigen ligase family protein [Elusimicrobiaceae bacterium]|nr:O-antigen ligase family protein [Elusimicrobiaceae bacterium]